MKLIVIFELFYMCRVALTYTFGNYIQTYKCGLTKGNSNSSGSTDKFLLSLVTACVTTVISTRNSSAPILFQFLLE